ncbi:hypothetical protein FAM09_13815 [Niastella caeni]|uniref:Uncharacterized protein n=1 Tax=Niastella caeni TaxID=2569763 RepID=A0A4S8HZG4_9BACT|nr:hypothetical protein [Niastella caeni]THU39574.1 hypothetical protein FAM09_13815 [Niastella caeni]
MRTLLIILIAFVGITATLIGMLLIAYPVLRAYNFPVDFFQPAFSQIFIVPGILFIITGSINLVALANTMKRRRTQYSWSIMGGMAMIAWVVIHSVVLQAIPWLYHTYLICSLLIVLLSWQLKGKWAV